MTGLYTAMQMLQDDFAEKLDSTFPKPFGKDRYELAPLTWTHRGVGIYPAAPQGYILEEDGRGATAWVAVDIDCGKVSLTATIPYLDALRRFIWQEYSDISLVKAIVDVGLGPQNDQGLVSALLEVRLDYRTDKGGVRNGSPAFR